MNTTFASDNYSGVHPDIFKALQDANIGHQSSYGADDHTKRAQEVFKKVFGDCQVIFTSTGTAANVLSLKLLLGQAYEAVITPETSHLLVAEVGAAQKTLGVQLIPTPTRAGKLTVADLDIALEWYPPDDIHNVLPKIVSIAQSTEYGTIYTAEEVKAIADWCHKHDMYLHMDGCRLPNAAVALDQGLKELTRDVGVDVLSFGGAKNGLMNAEAVVVFNAPKSSLPRHQKQLLQLTSKMRYLSAQFVPYLENELWKTNAAHANQLAQQLADGLAKLTILLTQPVETNQVFAKLDPKVVEKLHAAGHHFYKWNSEGNEYRFVTSWDNSKQDILNLLNDIARFSK